MTQQKKENLVKDQLSDQEMMRGRYVIGDKVL